MKAKKRKKRARVTSARVVKSVRKRLKVARVPKHKHKAKIVLLGRGSNCKSAESSQTLLGGGSMAAKKVMPWFKKSKRARRRGRASLLGGAVGGGRGIQSVLVNGAVTVGGAAAGSLLAARLPLPGKLAGFRGLVPVVAGVALGASKFGRKPIMQYLALGMVVAGGLAVGRQFAPQLFAGEDEMLGLPVADETLGIAYAGDESDESEDMGDDVLGAVYQSGESPDEVELFGDFATGADV